MKHLSQIVAPILAPILVLALAGACSPTPKTPSVAEAPAAPVSAPAPPVPPTTAANPVPNAADDACNVAAYAALVGKTDKDPTVPPAGPSVRRIHPGDQVTMDYRADRLNIDIDAKGVITALRCG